ncbi:hypothetical protein [Nonlabens xiamenensis]|uniref:hypothetical protein n=1 Tax=Nonlabens xiamenensis TaxID=2341043 RepID=UPI000F60DECC|nr:hypothetical protein [Nonlabens xiamenensis]
MKKLYVVTAILILFISCKSSTEHSHAEKEDKTESLTLSGSVTNQKGIAGRINVLGYFVDPIYTGDLEPGGKFKIVLPKDFGKLTQEAFADYNRSEEAQYELNLSTAIETFPDAGDLNFVNKQARLAFAGKYYRFEVVDPSGNLAYLSPASSQDFLEFVIGKPDASPLTGHHYYFIYALEAFSIKGTDTYLSLYEDGSEESYKRTDEYQLDIQLGWNIIKYEVMELSENNLGSQNVGKSKTISVDPTQEIINWQVTD